MVDEAACLILCQFVEDYSDDEDVDDIEDAGSKNKVW